MDMLSRKTLVMGFGHRVYKTSDPRSAVIKDWAGKLAKSADQMEDSACTEERAESAPVIAPDVELTATDRERLTFFKWRYVLQADGFASAQARRLTFMRWLYLQGRLAE